MRTFIIIEVFRYFPLLSALENMALRKDVWESNPWKSNQNWNGSHAVDGRYTDRSAQGGQCVISESGAQTATWRVDLGGVVSISHINIYYRTDNKPHPTPYTSRMAGFFLYVSNKTSREGGHLCFHEIQTEYGRPSEDQRINCSVHGRYVVYYNERLSNVTYPSYYSTYAFYELCELEVYGCSNVGFYGPNCNAPCPTNCQEKRCDVNTGHCLGCVPGHQGWTCDQICDQHTYGLECSQSCGNCINGETCNHVNGICLHGCNEGVQGSRCKSECSPGYYGKDCKHECSENCNVTRRCNRFTGVCEGGCTAGWMGATCDMKCGGGYFGQGCRRKCGHCLNTTQCHYVHGTCSNGCFAGYMGMLCEEKCPSGTFGLNCLSNCSTHCTGNGLCNFMTGVCDEGCKGGWDGPVCDKAGPLLPSYIVIIICSAVSIVIVVIGSILNYCIYRKKGKNQNVQTRKSPAVIPKLKGMGKKEKPVKEYSELEEVDKQTQYDNFQYM